jgi:lactoylglutathione lyase
VSTRSFVGAVGIAVADLAKSADFYKRIFGMTTITKLKLPEMDEIILGFEGSKGAAVVLMHYTDGSDPDTTNLPVKVVLYVPDPGALADAVAAEGLEVVRVPEPVPELGGTVIGFVKDPDGYTIELIGR